MVRVVGAGAITFVLSGAFAVHAAQVSPAAPSSRPPIAAQNAAGDLRIGVIDLQRVAALSHAGKAATATLEELRNRKATELAAKNKELESLQQQLSQKNAVANQAAALQLQRQAERTRTELQRMNQDAEQEVRDLQNELLQRFTATLFPIVQQVAKQKNVWAVFRSDQSTLVLYHDKAIDLTDDVVARLDAGSAAPASPPAAPPAAPPKP